MQFVFFDMDGTLLDSMNGWKNVKHNMLKSYCERTGKEINNSDDLIGNLESLTVSNAIKHIEKVTGFKIDRQKDIYDILRDYYLNESTVKPGVKELLEKLCADGVKMAVATATPKELAEEALKHHGIYDYFIKIYTPENLNGGKSKPEFFKMLAKDNHKFCRNCVIIDDAAYSLKAAKAAKFRAIGIFDKVRNDDVFSVADAAFHDFNEILDHYNSNGKF